MTGHGSDIKVMMDTTICMPQVQTSVSKSSIKFGCDVFGTSMTITGHHSDTNLFRTSTSVNGNNRGILVVHSPGTMPTALVLRG